MGLVDGDVFLGFSPVVEASDKVEADDGAELATSTPSTGSGDEYVVVLLGRISTTVLSVCGFSLIAIGVVGLAPAGGDKIE